MSKELNLKDAENYGKKAQQNGINIIAADKEFMRDFCQRKVGQVMPYMKAWKKGWMEENEKAILEWLVRG